MNVNIAYYIDETFSEGPGKRFAIWFQGCSIRCVGCINPELWDFNGGNRYDVKEIVSIIEKSKYNNNVEGVSFLGGEPFDQKKPLLKIIIGIKKLELNLIIYTGYTYNELLKKNDDIINDILANTDVLIDGKYIRELHTDNLYLRGSTNQKIIILSEKFKAADFDKKNSLDIRFKDNKLFITGFPFGFLNNE